MEPPLECGLKEGAPTQPSPAQQLPMQQQQRRRRRPAAPAAPPAHAQGSQPQPAPSPLDQPAAPSAAEPQRTDLPPPVVLVLIGVQGSGKSTLSARLMEGHPGCWVRINQDTISNGKRGTRKQCVRAAAAALARGQSVLIDRCNVDSAQRSDFLQVAVRARCPAHALVLQLPLPVCVQRAKARQGHEGGVEGPGAARAVSMMHGALVKAGPPRVAEGFSSIMLCSSEGDVAPALAAWQAHGAAPPADPVTLWEVSPPGQRQLRSGLPVRGHGRIPPPLPRPVPAAPAADSVAAGAGQKRGRGAAEEAAAPSAKRSRSSDAAPAASSGSAGGGTATGGSCKYQGTPPGASPAAGLASAGKGAAKASSGPNAFALLMAGARAQKAASAAASPARAAHAGRGGAVAAAGAEGPTSTSGGGGGGGLWSQVLRDVAADPDRQRSSQDILHVDAMCVLMLDKFPKARHHALVVAREPGLDSMQQLTPRHLPLLSHMRTVALAWARRVGTGAAPAQPLLPDAMPTPPTGASAAAGPAAAAGDGEQPVPEGWQIGFHAVPSMQQLHLHVISRDFDSACLKNKKHWNSFFLPSSPTAPPAFFQPLDRVVEEVRRSGGVAVDRAAAEQLLKGPLCCHRCGCTLTNMPQLKQHIGSCSGGA